MTVHENETMSSTAVPTDGFGLPVGVDPQDAEYIIGAFLAALGELGYPAPSNTYRALITRRGLEVEVFDDGARTETTYGTAAPLEEIDEFVKRPTRAFKPGDRIRAVRNTESWGDGLFPKGTEMVVGSGDGTRAYIAPDSFGNRMLLIAGPEDELGMYLVDAADFERVP